MHVGCVGHCIVCYRICGARVVCHEEHANSSVISIQHFGQKHWKANGAGEKPRCRLCPCLVSQHVMLTGMCLTSCLVHSRQPHGSHSHIRAQCISGVTHEEPSPTAFQNADAACPPWAISGQSLSPASIPMARSPASPQPHLGTGAEQGWCGGRQWLCSRAAANTCCGSWLALAQGLLHRLI